MNFMHLQEKRDPSRYNQLIRDPVHAIQRAIDIFHRQIGTRSTLFHYPSICFTKHTFRGPLEYQLHALESRTLSANQFEWNNFVWTRNAR